MTSTNEQTNFQLTEEILEKMTEILDEKFEYDNDLSFNNEEEFIVHYGNKLYEKTISIFKEKWYQILGDSIITGLLMDPLILKNVLKKHMLKSD